MNNLSNRAIIALCGTVGLGFGVAAGVGVVKYRESSAISSGGENDDVRGTPIEESESDESTAKPQPTEEEFDDDEFSDLAGRILGLIQHPKAKSRCREFLATRLNRIVSIERNPTVSVVSKSLSRTQAEVSAMLSEGIPSVISPDNKQEFQKLSERLTEALKSRVQNIMTNTNLRLTTE